MPKPLMTAVLVVVMVAIVVGVDVSLFRHRPTQRLLVNIGIVLVFGLIYVKFVKG